MSALVTLSRKRAEAVAEAEGDEPPREVAPPEAAAEAVGQPTAWQGWVAMVVGLTVATVCAGVLGSQLWHVSKQLERQRRIRALVAEAGLPSHFVPKVESSNRWAIGSSLGVVFGLFWVVWGVVRYRDEQQRRELAVESVPEELADAAGAPSDTGELASHGRPARRRSGHRRRR